MGDKGEEQKLEGITEVQETDVLCGRGGAALRHAGNQTYRKLVSLNKGLYITCLKTEKLKISRSIVAAIREKKGRFLEKDAATGTWYDIGDKKAVEKTSQALREGQPKLRQQIVEMGGGAVGAASLIESQFGPQAAAAVAGAGLYPNDQLGGHQMMHPQSMAARSGSMQQQMMAQQGYPGMQHQQQMNGLPFDDIQNDLMQRLSLHDVNNGHDNNAMQQQQMRNMRHQMNHRGGMMTNGMGMVGESQMSLLSECSTYGAQGNPMGPLDDGSAGVSMDASFRAAMQGMASPPGSIQGSLNSTQHTLDLYSMHSMQDNMNGISGHSAMGPPPSHLPSMSSISRQHQIDERFPLQEPNMGIDLQAMSRNFRAQSLDNRSPPQPRPPEQHPDQRIESINSQPQKNHPGLPNRGYGMPKNGGDDLDPVAAFHEGYPSHQRQQEQQRSGYPNQQQQQRQMSGGYSDEQIARGVYYDELQERGGDSGGRGYEEPVRGLPGRGEEDSRQMGPPDRYNQGQNNRVFSSNQGNQNNGGHPGAIYAGNSSTPTGTQPSVLGASSRHKMDRRNMFARMKFTRPPSYRDSKMTLGGASTHSQLSTGDGMPDIHMVESQLSLHSTLSAMTDGNSSHLPNRSTKGSWVERAPIDKGIYERAPVDKGLVERAPIDKGPLVERVPVVDHSSRSDYMDVLATGSKHSLMSGLSRISDHSANDASIFSSLSKAIGNVSTRSIAMSEISVIDVAERDGEDERSSNHDEPTESQD